MQMGTAYKRQCLQFEVTHSGECVEQHDPEVEQHRCSPLGNFDKPHDCQRTLDTALARSRVAPIVVSTHEKWPMQPDEADVRGHIEED